MTSTIETPNHVLQLMSLEQRRESLPYAGFPTRRQLRHTIEHAVQHARNGNAPVYLITPRESPVHVAPDIPNGISPDEYYATLPPVRCVGHFRSEPINPDSGAFRSELTFVWWQNDWASPIDPEISREIATVDWPLHARDFLD